MIIKIEYVCPDGPVKTVIIDGVRYVVVEECPSKDGLSVTYEAYREGSADDPFREMDAEVPS